MLPADVAGRQLDHGGAALAELTVGPEKPANQQ